MHIKAREKNTEKRELRFEEETTNNVISSDNKCWVYNRCRGRWGGCLTNAGSLTDAGVFGEVV